MIIREYKKAGEVFIFDDHISENHPDYYAGGLDGHAECENDHFWFVARKEFLLNRFRKHIDPESRGIDIGAGTGNVTGYLISNGYKNICVGDMHRKGLDYARRYGSKELYQFDILKATFEDEFDFVCLFDLLEHIHDEDAVLQNVARMLRKGNGKVVLTVPAHQWLWSLYDRAATHKRRYSKKELRKKLMQNGFDVLEMKYFFMSIVPLLFLRSVFKPDRGLNYQGYRAEESAAHPVISNFLLWICRAENRLTDFLPNFFGGSLFVIAGVANQKFKCLDRGQKG